MWLHACTQAKFPAAQTLHFCNLLRWWDLLQHTADVKGLYQPLAFAKPRFVAPLPPAAAAPKAAAATADKGSDKGAAAASASSKSSATTAAAAAGAAPAKGGDKAAGVAAKEAEGGKKVSALHKVAGRGRK